MRLFLLLIPILLFSCKKETETVVFQNNNIPQYNEIPTILVENYVNRLYIDLIGREPTDQEMAADVAALEAASLTAAARISIADKLMNSTVFIEGDSSYAHAYHQKFYDDNKARFIDGASESEVYESYYLYYFISVQDSLAGNMLAYEVNRLQANKMLDVINSRYQLRNGLINVSEVCRRMCFNQIYDDINMNTFNYINATFDDLFFRFPTEAEIDEAFEPIEQLPSSEDPDLTGYLFGEVFSNKSEYIELLTSCDEFGEGLIRWVYFSLLNREPSTPEIVVMLNKMGTNYDIEAVQKAILSTDEYAGFDNI
jgi:hypothetical protein